jgi:hypothetical protein
MGRQYQFVRVRKIFAKATKLGQTLQNCKRKLLMKRFFIRMKWAKEHVNWIYEIAWNIVVSKQREKANLILQRTLRGYLERRSCTQEIEQLADIKDMLEIRRHVVKMQKWVRGFLVRHKMDRLKRASKFIGGFLRMRWLRKWF